MSVLLGTIVFRAVIIVLQFPLLVCVCVCCKASIYSICDCMKMFGFLVHNVGFYKCVHYNKKDDITTDSHSRWNNTHEIQDAPSVTRALNVCYILHLE